MSDLELFFRFLVPLLLVVAAISIVGAIVLEGVLEFLVYEYK